MRMYHTYTSDVQLGRRLIMFRIGCFTALHSLALDAVSKTCDQCEKQFHQKVAILIHAAEEHQSSQLDQVTCPYCPLVFAAERTDRLRQHLSQIHGDVYKTAEYQCDLCHLQFKDRRGSDNGVPVS